MDSCESSSRRTREGLEHPLHETAVGWDQSPETVLPYPMHVPLFFTYSIIFLHIFSNDILLRGVP